MHKLTLVFSVDIFTYMDYKSHTPSDGEVYSLSSRNGYIKAEFIDTKGSDGAERRLGWRLTDRFGRGILLTSEELQNLYDLMTNYFNK